ncbi:MAG: SDR family NAD(P)-dependent oxidoreductase [Halioglobus sp.]|nr:SDR family NAD(P)-dependent oxidoreductase [Halioglobus sp.]
MSGTKAPRTLFITGGMSGLGRALAAAYLRRGADVAIFDLATNADVLRELEACRQRSSGKIIAYQVSVTDFAALSDAVRQAVEVIGDPELAINCAGMQRAAPFGQLSREDFELVVQVNLFGTRNFAAAVIPHMKARARLALVASMAGFAANYSYATYCASKFAVVGLGKVLRLELKPQGIDVSLICPPEVDTPMVVEEARTMHPVSRALKDLGGSLSVEEAIAGILAGLDAGRSVIIPGAKAKLTYFCNRYLPNFVMNFFVDTIVGSVLRKMAAGNLR